MYCPVDQRNIVTERGYSLGILILLIIIIWPAAIIYYFMKRESRCPMCKTPENKLLAAQPTGPMGMAGGPMPGYMPAPPMAQPAMTAGQAQNCPSCGKPLTWNAQNNRWFCSAENKWI